MQLYIRSNNVTIISSDPDSSLIIPRTSQSDFSYVLSIQIFPSLIFVIVKSAEYSLANLFALTSRTNFLHPFQLRTNLPVFFYCFILAFSFNTPV